MKTVQMTLNDELVEAVDKAAKRMRKSRSAFARDALREALRRIEILELERRHREGYARKPVGSLEFDAWVGEQVWPE